MLIARLPFSLRPLAVFALIASFGLVSAVGRGDDSPGSSPGKVRVYILAGQSNMDGYGGLEALDWQARHAERKDEFQLLLDGEGWDVRDDAWIVFGDRRGALTAGFGVGKDFMGVEWEFGRRMAEQHDEPVLLIKNSWGGASIRRKFRPPSSGDATKLIEEEHARNVANWEKEKEKNPDARKPVIEEVRAIYGENWRQMVAQVNATVADIGAVIPGYAGQGYEIAGFVWFQGFNDQFGDAPEEYATHLANLIRDVRKEWNVPTLPVVVGQMGHGGTKEEREKRGLNPIGDGTRKVKDAQAAVAEAKEFTDTVRLVTTDRFWDWKAQEVFDKGWREHIEEWKRIGAHYPYHYLGSPWTFMKIGQAFGEAMVELESRK